MATDIIARGIAANKADLIGGKVPAEQLPSYVDDVIEKPDYASLPQPGETGKIYITTNDNTTYRWSGSTYVLIGSSGTYRPFPNGQINGTLQQVVSAIMTFPDKKAGMAYLGGIAGACLSSLGLINAECTVSFMTDSIAVLSLSSSDTIPYHWEYNTASSDYIWKKWADVSGSGNDNCWEALTINSVNKRILPAYPTFDQTKQYVLTLVPNTNNTAYELKWVEKV